jgi:hypothetical protein
MSVALNLGRGNKSLFRERHGNVLVLSAFLMIVMVAFVALGIDIGYISVARTELQRTADSAAMASAWELLNEDRLRGPEYVQLVRQRARDAAASYAEFNRVCGASPTVDKNEGNSIDGDVVFGRYEDGEMSTDGAISSHNAVRVRVVRDQERNGEVPFFFARALGVDSAGASAEAIATFRDGISGFRAVHANPFTSLLPFALDIKDWNNLMAGIGADNWNYNALAKSLGPGSDGVREIRLYPSKQQGGGIVPGNFGTVDIGNPGNSTSVLSRQISEGVSSADLAYHGGELKLDPISKTAVLNGETGLSIGMEAALGTVRGKARTIPLYSSVAQSGNTAQFTIVGFVGVRVLDFDLHGKNKYIMIQPAVVVDEAAISEESPTSYYVYQPVYLVK